MQGHPSKRELVFSALVTAVAGFLISTIACANTNISTRVVGGSMERPAFERYFLKQKERKQGIPAESEWNQLKIWRKISSSPDVYIPRGFTGSMPLKDSDGMWFHDERDGKKLFVPNEQTGDFSPQVLRGEAKKITTWFYD